LAGFRKAKAEQAALKVGMYGPPGSGKTFTTCLFLEGLSKLTGKRTAYVDTERGTDFYVQAVPSRQHHPEAFDIDTLYTKEITTVLDAIKDLPPSEYCAVALDSITHLWQACMNAYSGKMTKIDTIPLQAWGAIKKPYKELMNFLLSSPFHVFILGRQGNEFVTDDDSGELKKVGVKMKAEGETAYEPHILFQMEAVRNPKDKSSVITLFAEKDRTGVLAGQTIAWPNFDNVIKPLLPLLGTTQAKIASDDEAGQHDAERLEEAEQLKTSESESLATNFKARIALCSDVETLTTLGKEITPELKKRMTAADVADVRKAFLQAQQKIK
jgi:hypothetical protein